MYCVSIDTGIENCSGLMGSIGHLALAVAAFSHRLSTVGFWPLPMTVTGDLFLTWNSCDDVGGGGGWRPHPRGILSGTCTKIQIRPQHQQP